MDARGLPRAPGGHRGGRPGPGAAVRAHLLLAGLHRPAPAPRDLIVGNHETLRPAAEQFAVPFHHVPITPDSKAEQERAELALLREHHVDTVVLARYMQILTEAFLEGFDGSVINIHHSFLPAFVGANPYRQAHARGVKVIGATSHYVTPDLDQGPIIAQDVIHVSHRDSVADFVRQGKDLEKVVLARAVWHHVRNRVLTYHNKTVVF